MKTLTIIALALAMVGAAQPTPAQAGWWDDVKSFFSRVGTPADEVNIRVGPRGGIAVWGSKRNPCARGCSEREREQQRNRDNNSSRPDDEHGRRHG